MVSNILDPIGAVWLMSVFNIKPAFRFAVVSVIAKRRKTEIEKKQVFAKNGIQKATEMRRNYQISPLKNQ